MLSQTETFTVESLEENPVPGHNAVENREDIPVSGHNAIQTKTVTWRAERITQYLSITLSQTKTVIVESLEDYPVPGHNAILN